MPFRCSPGGPDIVSTKPDVDKLEQIAGYGNCLFRALSLIITGCQEQHFPIRTLIANHMLSIQNL